jgi:glycosyltransferase involved in cell wall biosynthesis
MESGNTIAMLHGALYAEPISDAVYPYGMLDPWLRRTYPLKHLKKWLHWLWADYRVFRDARAVLFATEQEMQLASQRSPLYRANAHMVRHGTSVSIGDSTSQREMFLSRYPGLRGKRLLLFFSRIHPKKGLDLLIEAFSPVSTCEPSLNLVIAGPDEVRLTISLQQCATALSIANCITWPGVLTGDLRRSAFRCSELFCLPSNQENSGLTLAACNRTPTRPRLLIKIIQPRSTSLAPSP